MRPPTPFIPAGCCARDHRRFRLGPGRGASQVNPFHPDQDRPHNVSAERADEKGPVTSISVTPVAGLPEITPGTDLAALIESVARRFRASTSAVQITLDLPPNLPTVMADRDRIAGVLPKLLHNAMKY